jgi:hypothetical protein
MDQFIDDTLCLELEMNRWMIELDSPSDSNSQVLFSPAKQRGNASADEAGGTSPRLNFRA